MAEKKMKNITGTTNITSASSAADAKQITMMSVLRCVAKARSILMAIKSRTHDLRSRFSVFLSFKHERQPTTPPVVAFHCSDGDQAYDHHHISDDAIVAVAAEDGSLPLLLNNVDCRDDHKDDDDVDELDPSASVIELVRTSKEELGENFCLEAEIDRVADLFIMKFHRNMRLQKLESFKRCQQMLQRSAS